MKTIARFQVPEQAHLFRSFLASKSISGWVFDEYTVEVAWYYSNAIGGVRVVVNDADCDEAVRHFSEYLAALHKGPVLDNSPRRWPIVLLLSLFVGVPVLLFGRRNTYREVE
ncbi:MAG: hypothetical protein AAF491_12280 [Verrucomicrobiota bacterium]